MNGNWNGRVGAIGIMQRENYIAGACNSIWHEHTIVVRSAIDDSIKYSVHMPDGQKRKVYCTYASSWGKNAEFNFEAIDEIFKELTTDAKIDYLLERFHYQEGISNDTLNTLSRSISRNAKDIVAKIVSNDDVGKLALLEQYGIIKKNTIEERLDQADKAGAVMCKAWILQWQRDLSSKKK